MHQRRLALCCVCAAFLAVFLARVDLKGQATGAAKIEKASAVLRSPDGHPDLSGIWEHNAATPLERPDELAGRAVLTVPSTYVQARLDFGAPGIQLVPEPTAFAVHALVNGALTSHLQPIG